MSLIPGDCSARTELDNVSFGIFLKHGILIVTLANFNSWGDRMANLRNGDKNKLVRFVFVLYF